MKDFMERFIGKCCSIRLSNIQIHGVIKEVSNGAMIVDQQGTIQVINLMHVISLYEYPTKENKKKKIKDLLSLEEQN